MEDEIPSTLNGRILSLADKWDTLAECFKVGMMPTGSRDPFGLRRAAQGMVRIIVEGNVKLRFAAGAANWPSSCVTASNTTSATSAASPTTKSVPAWPSAGTICSTLAAPKRVQAVRPTPDFEPIAASFKRIKNILKQADYSDGGSYREDLLEPGPELALHQEMPRTKDLPPWRSASARCGPKWISSSTRCWSTHPTWNIRRNRLALLHNLLTEFSDDR